MDKESKQVIEDIKNVADDLFDLFTRDPKELKKQFIQEDYDKYKSKIEPYLHLWKKDNKEWMENRKESWRKIIERESLEYGGDFVKSYWEAEGRFYLRGKPRKSDKEIFLHRRMAYTPFDLKDQIVELYSLAHVSSRASLHGQLLSYASKIYKAVPEEFHRVEFIAKALYSKEYVAKMEKTGPLQKLNFVVHPPSDFILSYAGETKDYIKNSQNKQLIKPEKYRQFYTGQERSYVEVTFDYFLGSLEYVVKNEIMSKRTVKRIKEMCGQIQNYSPYINSEYRDAFIEKASDIILENELVKNVLCMED